MSLAGYAPKQLAYHRGTTNLRDHLTRVHMDKYKPAKRTINRHWRPSCRSVLMLEQKLINELIVNVVTLNIRPLTIVDGEGMRRLLL